MYSMYCCHMPWCFYLLASDRCQLARQAHRSFFMSSELGELLSSSLRSIRGFSSSRGPALVGCKHSIRYISIYIPKLNIAYSCIFRLHYLYLHRQSAQIDTMQLVRFQQLYQLRCSRGLTQHLYNIHVIYLSRLIRLGMSRYTYMLLVAQSRILNQRFVPFSSSFPSFFLSSSPFCWCIQPEVLRTCGRIRRTFDFTTPPIP